MNLCGTMRAARTTQVVVLTLALCVLGPTASGERRGIEGKGAHAVARAGTPTTADDDLAADLRFTHTDRQLHYGTARQADLVGEHLAQTSTDLRRYLQPSPTHPLYAGGTVLSARHGVIALHDAAGMAVRYADADTELPVDQQVPARRDTIYDLASVTKTFTSIAVMQQVEAGRIDLDAPVASYLPDFAQNGKGDITIRHGRGAVRRRTRRRACRRPRREVPLLRPEPDHPWSGRRRCDGPVHRRRDRRSHHQAARDDRHHVQPAGIAA